MENSSVTFLLVAQIHLFLLFDPCNQTNLLVCLSSDCSSLRSHLRKRPAVGGDASGLQRLEERGTLSFSLPYLITSFSAVSNNKVFFQL